MKIDLSQLITAEAKTASAIATHRTQYSAAVEAHIEAVAQSRQFSGASSLASYTASTNLVWQAEARAFIAWRDAVWVSALAQMDALQQSGAVWPPVATLLADLPKITWP